MIDDFKLIINQKSKIINFKMVTIYINGNSHTVSSGKNLLDTCLSLGYDVPYFCFHPAMGSVGACRLCAVKVFYKKNVQQGRMVMSCMEPVVDGMTVSIDDPEIVKFRASIIESLMTNHPHDCPVCDEGGECHLQDMTVMSGHNYRRFDYKKRTHKNQYLGPYIHHEMNRCIQCYRCVRFYRDYAGGKDLNAFASRNNVYFGRHEEGQLESPFSGNLVEVCPTGVFTDNTLRPHHTRKWDLTNSPSICTQCSVGCNTIVSERYGQVRRIMNRYNHEINGFFICDRGRFGYQFINQPDRFKTILARQKTGDEFTETDIPSQTKIAADAIKSAKNIVAIGSPKASLESNYALLQLAGKENFYQGISDTDFAMVNEAVRIYNQANIHIPSLKEIENADAVLILGEDVLQTAPILALAIRQASRNKPLEMVDKLKVPRWHDIAAREITIGVKGDVFFATPEVTNLDEVAKYTYRASPENIANFGFAIASIIKNSTKVTEKLNERVIILAETIASSIVNAKNPVIITGTQYGNPDVLKAAEAIAEALLTSEKKASLYISLPECNSLGLSVLGGKSLGEAIQVVKDNKDCLVMVLENDLYKSASKTEIDILLEQAGLVFSFDYLPNDTNKKAHCIFPTGTFAESDGTIINSEGRAQRYFRAIPLANNIKDSWRYLSDLCAEKDCRLKHWLTNDEVLADIASDYPILNKITNIVPKNDFRMEKEKIPRQTLRFSGRTAMNAKTNIHEPMPPQDDNSPLAFSMEGYKNIPPASLTTHYWKPGWNSVQAINKYTEELNGPLKNKTVEVKIFNK
jgi:NADH-quinone oxidoreductase subunit G